MHCTKGLVALTFFHTAQADSELPAAATDTTRRERLGALGALPALVQNPTGGLRSCSALIAALSCLPRCSNATEAAATEEPQALLANLRAPQSRY